jgi:predicted GNAT family acetyltransferase
LDFARETGKTVDPQCSYAAAFLEQHPEYAGLREQKS